jgi:uncharacterized membrane protein YsdA (DUF1294 family)
MISLADAATALVAINFIAFAAFGLDKSRAETGGWRIRESTLLWLALLGGSLGAFAGRHLFRHKTRKQPFVSRLWFIAGVQVVGVGLAIGWMMG